MTCDGCGMHLTKAQLLELNEYNTELYPLDVEWGRCLEGSEAWLNCRRRKRSKVREQWENSKHLCPLGCAIIGVWIAESNLAFFPWKVFGLVLAGASAVYVVRVMWRTDKKDSKT